jgi:hypothetical protein
VLPAVFPGCCATPLTALLLVSEACGAAAGGSLLRDSSCPFLKRHPLVCSRLGAPMVAAALAPRGGVTAA